MFTRQHSNRDTQVNAMPVRAHVEALIGAGYPPALIARLAGVETRRVAVLLDDQRTERGTARVEDGTRRRERRAAGRIAAALLAVPIPDAMFVAATGPVRRLRALVRIGYPFDILGGVLGYDEALLRELALGVPEIVDAELAELLVDLFERWHVTPGPSGDAREFGRRHRWAAPLAWAVDEEDVAGSIDDPHASPVGVPPVVSRQVPADFADIVADHRDLGHFDEEIAEAFGLSLDAMARRLHRAGLGERRRGAGTTTRPALYGARYAIRLPWQVVA